MDALEHELEQRLNDYFLEAVKREARRLWNSGGIDTEDFNLSVGACVHVALDNVAQARKPRSDNFGKIVRNLKSF